MSIVVNVPDHVEHEGAYINAANAKIVRNTRTGWLRKCAKHQFVNDYMVDYHGGSKIMLSFQKQWEERGKISDKQVDTFFDILSKWEQNKRDRQAVRDQEHAAAVINAKHVGTVGEKMECVLTCVRIIEIQGTSFSYYDTGITDMCICADQGGNPIVYKGRGNFLKAGETGTVKFTVKSHSVYNGVAQTFIQRPKVLSRTTPDQTTPESI